MREHINHTLIDIDCGGVGECKFNVRTGRIRYSVPVFGVGNGNFAIEASLVYGSICPIPKRSKAHMGNTRREAQLA